MAGLEEVIKIRECIRVTMRIRESLGYVYEPATLETATAAAQAVSTVEAQIMAIENILTARERKNERV